MQLPVLEEGLLEEPHLVLVRVHQLPVVDLPHLVPHLIVVQIVEIALFCLQTIETAFIFVAGLGLRSRELGFLL
jgi:hypothetical protein